LIQTAALIVPACRAATLEAAAIIGMLRLR
jgi:hypothetical protein